MKYPYTGIILSGGLSTRLSGKNKAFIEINGKRIIDNTCAIFKRLFKEVILVTNNPESYVDLGVKMVSDIYPVRSSMTGLHAGIYNALYPFTFAVACDSPFLNRQMIENILSHITEETFIIVPKVEKGFEPLCAVYSKKCLPSLEDAIENKRYRILGIFDKGNTVKIPEADLRKFDPELLSFFNINTPRDLEKAKTDLARIYRRQCPDNSGRQNENS
ncbi:molybdenum cofactor guanylyltransferase [Desulfocicer vacuolatum DSM 3385]|uniref:Probable molybdenum cofactor guanylyltransferase n=1 Tax=Desulfocicer vacuolatum DSM 3385 TaxID=1121400 RepID=A0A1W1ZXD8_9BACT|nr:molybdenum cofactor guanylyltransferase [Desulfocicer vacuolatum]SMC52801.1 molybdenum cofactor guanylyltransferase [Desulfocicer vacuolatum DSM 3385]